MIPKDSLMGATNKGAVSKLVKAWEAKNGQSAKRVAGLGLMAVSLAACGGADDDIPTVTISQMLATDDLPASYNISITSAVLGAITVEQLENFSAEAGAALNVVAYAAALAGDSITVTYSIADTAEAIIAAAGGFGDVDVVVTGNPTLSIADLEALEEIGATFSGSVTVEDSAANILASSADMSDASIVVTDTSLTPAQVAALEALSATFGTVTVQQALTTGTDTFVGTSLNDVITANFENGLNEFSAADTVDGGAGTDTLNITTIANYTDPVGATVTGVENASITANGTVIANTTAWTGLTSLTSTAVGDADLTAAATTNVTSNVSSATLSLTVLGGNNVTVNATGVAAGTITVGTVTNSVGVGAAGNVVVNASGTAAGSTIGAIAVSGGDTITVNLTAGNAANTSQVLGNVTVTGDAGTTAVTINNAAATLATPALVGVGVGGRVLITDAADATNLLADSISTVTLSNFGGTNAGTNPSTITSSALTTLNITGGVTGLASGDLNIVAQSTVTPATALTINSAGGAMGSITGAAGAALANYTSIAINSSAATTIAGLTTGATTTALNFNGAGATTLTANTFNAALVDINVNGIGGVTLGTALAATTDFDGNEGADSIIITGASALGYTMAGGNDTVEFTATSIGANGFFTGGAATAGSLSGGAGTDTLVMAAADAVLASSTGAFNADVTGFEVLRLDDAFTTGVIDVDGLNDVTRVEISTAGTTATISNLNNGGTVALEANMTGLTVGVQSAVAGTADVLNIELNGVAAISGTVAAANVETINISAADANALTGAAVRHTVVLTGSTGLTSVLVSGNNGMTVTGEATVTNFDASGVVANDASDTGAQLAVSYTSLNNTATDAVSITGGAGNDTLIGGGALNSINGGAGDDTITGGALSDVIDGGAGTDTYIGAAGGISVTLNGATAATVTVTGGAIDTIRNIENVTGGAGVDTITGDAADNTIIGGAGDDVITGGAGVDTLTGGADDDLFVFGNADSGLTASSSDVITDFVTGADTISLGLAGDAAGPDQNFVSAGAAVANFAAALTAANTALATLAANSTATELYAFEWDGANGYLFNDTDGDGDADQVITLTGIDNNDILFSDIVA